MNAQAWLGELRYSARHPLARTGRWVLAGGAVCMVVALAVWWPAQRTDRALQEQIDDKRRMLVEMRQADELIRLYTLAQQVVPVLEKKLEQRVSQVQFVEGLAGAARKHGVRIVSENYDGVRGEGSEATMVADLTVQGSYRGIRDFLREFSNLPMWTDVQEVRLERARGSALVKGRIRVATYRGTASSGAPSP